MNRRLLSLVLSVCLLLSLAIPAAAAKPMAYASTQTVQLNGQPVELQAYALRDAKGNPTNYVKLRDIAWLLRETEAKFEVTWDGAVNAVTGQDYTATGAELTTPYSGDRAYSLPKTATRVNGRETALEAIILTDDKGGDYTYYKLRDLGAALGFGVDWDKELGIVLSTAPETKYVPDGSYDEAAFEANYFTLPERLSTIRLFKGEVKEGKPGDYMQKVLKDQPDTGVTVRALNIDGVPVYEGYVDDGKVKPMILLLHGGGGSKDNNAQNILDLAQLGLYVVALDSAAHGESNMGPLQSALVFAETVRSIDTILEYYNTVAQADPCNAGIVGGSVGGAIAYCYAAHGRYTMKAIFPCIGTPNLTQMGEKSYEDCYDHGKAVAPVWTAEQCSAFAAAYSPHQYPERFVNTYVYAGNGAKDSIPLEGPQDLKAAVEALGGAGFDLIIDPDRGHERLPEYYDKLFDKIVEVLLGE